MFDRQLERDDVFAAVIVHTSHTPLGTILFRIHLERIQSLADVQTYFIRVSCHDKLLSLGFNCLSVGIVDHRVVCIPL